MLIPGLIHWRWRKIDAMEIVEGAEDLSGYRIRGEDGDSAAVIASSFPPRRESSLIITYTRKPPLSIPQYRIAEIFMSRSLSPSFHFV